MPFSQRIYFDYWPDTQLWQHALTPAPKLLQTSHEFWKFVPWIKIGSGQISGRTAKRFTEDDNVLFVAA